MAVTLLVKLIIKIENLSKYHWGDINLLFGSQVKHLKVKY